MRSTETRRLGDWETGRLEDWETRERQGEKRRGKEKINGSRAVDGRVDGGAGDLREK